MALYSATSEIEAANLALSLIRVNGIADFDQAHSLAAREVKQWFGTIRDRLQREYRWNLASAREPLAELDAAPSSRWKHAYQLPADCIRARQLVGFERAEWDVEGRMLLCDAKPPLHLEYTKRVTDVAQWPADFLEVFAYSLAAACGPKLCRDRAIVRDIQTEAAGLASAAKMVDAREGRDRMDEYESSFVTIRRTGVGPWHSG